MTKILIVDDDPAVRGLLVTTARRLGHEVQETGSGLEARTWIAEESFDLAVVDVLLEEIDGFTLLREFLERHPEGRTIVISGGGRVAPQRYLDTAAVLGAHQTLCKPFSLEGFREAIAAET